MQFKIFKNQKIIHGILETNYGSVKKGDSKPFKKFLKNLGFEKKLNFIFAQQNFEGKVFVCSKKDLLKVIKGVDGLITNIPFLALVVLSADCVPVYMGQGYV